MTSYSYYQVLRYHTSTRSLALHVRTLPDFSVSDYKLRDTKTWQQLMITLSTLESITLLLLTLAMFTPLAIHTRYKWRWDKGKATSWRKWMWLWSCASL